MPKFINLSVTKTVKGFCLAIACLLSGSVTGNEKQQFNQCQHTDIDTREIAMDKNITKNQQPKPITSTSKGGISKPLSDSAGNAHEHKKEELYIVPNQFPFRDEAKEENDAVDCQTKKNKMNSE